MVTILLIEDNEINRDMLSRRLARKGYKVLNANDGQQGIDMANDHHPDLILMDIGLPNMNGWKATEILKSSPESKHIPIIILSAHATAEDREKSFLCGCDDFTTKPINFSSLIEKIEIHVRAEL